MKQPFKGIARNGSEYLDNLMREQEARARRSFIEWLRGRLPNRSKDTTDDEL